MSFTFNNELVDFRLLPADINQIDAVQDENLILHLPRRPCEFSDLIKHGIRFMHTNDFRGFICVICDEKLADLKNVDHHVHNFHDDQLNLLKKTPMKPVVGVEQVDLYYCEKTYTVVEFKCNLCDLVLSEWQIFWHIISYHHKLKFLKARFPTDPIIQMNDGKLKHEKMDEKLMEFDQNRGEFQRKRFEPGMMQSIRKDFHRLNLKFMKAGYQAATQKLAHITSDTVGFDLRSSLDRNLQLNIRNREEFDQGKELLQKINQALIQYQSNDNL